MAYTDYAASFVAADKPVTALLMGYIRDNTRYLKDRLVTGTGHTHNQAGTDEGGPVTPADNSVTQAKMADAAVGQAELKSTVGEVNADSSVPANVTLPGGTYGFYPQVKCGATTTTMAASIASGNTSGTYATLIYLSGDATSGHMVYAQHRYIQASPPYLIGQVIWGHFLFLLRDIATGTVRSAYQAEDPPWAYNGVLYLPEKDPGRIAAVPHPFADYWLKDPAIDGLEIVMVDLTEHDTKKWIADNAKLGKGLLEDLGSVITGKGIIKPNSDYLLPDIPKFTDRVKIVRP